MLYTCPMIKPDFSGTWRFNPSRSLLQIPPPDSTTFIIDHREPHFRLKRTLVHGQTADTFEIDLTTDGTPVRKRHGDLDFDGRLTWDADTLVFESFVTRGVETGTNIVRYQLADQGRTFIALEEVRSPNYNHSNRWVFDRA